MLTLDIINSRPKTCQRCGGLFRIAYSKDKDVQSKLIELHSTRQNMKFVKLLRQATNCDLKNAKGTYLHYGKSGVKGFFVTKVRESQVRETCKGQGKKVFLR